MRHVGEVHGDIFQGTKNVGEKIVNAEGNSEAGMLDDDTPAGVKRIAVIAGLIAAVSTVLGVAIQMTGCQPSITP